MTIPSYSNNNPHPTAVIREMRYMIRNAMAFYAPIADWCIETGLIKGYPAMGGVKVVGVRPTKYEITEAGTQYIEKYRDYDPESN